MAINPLLQSLVNTAKTSATVVKKNTETKAKNALGGLVTTQKETMPQARANALLPGLVKVAETTGKVGQANVAKKQEQAKELLGGMTNTVNQSYIQSKDIALSDLTSQIAEGVQQGATVNIQKLKDAYPEIANADDNVLQELSDQIAEGTAQGKTINIDKLRAAYPELYELPKVQPKQTIGDKIIGGISKVAPIISPLAGVVQKIGAKNVLNAGVGFAQGVSDVGYGIMGNPIGRLGEAAGKAVKDTGFSKWLQSGAKKIFGEEELRKYQESERIKRQDSNYNVAKGDITEFLPEDAQNSNFTKFGREAGKIGASTALTRPIGGGAKGVGLLGKAALGATEGVLGTAAYNVASGDEAFNTTSGIAGAIGGAIPLLGAGVKAAAKYAAPRLQLSGLLNPAKLNQVKDMLIDEGSELVGKMDTTDVGKWMIERGFKGGKDDIIKGLTQYSDESKKALDGLLSSSKSKHNVSSAKRALENIRASYADTPGLESKFAKVDQLLSKDAYTLTELNAIKREMDDAYNLFKSSGGETAGLKAEGLRNIRKDIRKYIEDVADVEGLGNVKMLNNETSVSRTLADAVSRKDSADIAREMLSVFSKPAIGGALSMNQGPFNGNTVEGKIGNFLVGGLLAGAVFSTTSKTYMANALRGLSGIQKKELSRFIATKGAEKLSKETIEEVAKVTNAIKLLKEGPLESNPLRLTTTPKTRTLGQGATVQTKRPLSLLTNNANTTDNIVNNTSGKVNKPRVNILAPKKSVPSDTLVSKSDEMSTVNGKNSEFFGEIQSREEIANKLSNRKPDEYYNHLKKMSNEEILNEKNKLINMQKENNIKIKEYNKKGGGLLYDEMSIENKKLFDDDIDIQDKLNKIDELPSKPKNILAPNKDLQPLYDEAKIEKAKELAYNYTKTGAGEKVMQLSKQKEVSDNLKYLPENKEKVYAGLTLDTDFIYDNLYDGATFESKRLLSSSTDLSIAKSFADFNPKNKNKIILEIDGGGYDVSDVSRYGKDSLQGEKEILFPIGSKFKVEKVEDGYYKLRKIREEANKK